MADNRIRKKILKGIRILFRCCLILAVAGTGCLLAGNYFVKKSSIKRIIDSGDESLPSVDCILILGCGLRPGRGTHPDAEGPPGYGDRPLLLRCGPEDSDER